MNSNSKISTVELVVLRDAELYGPAVDFGGAGQKASIRNAAKAMLAAGYLTGSYRNCRISDAGRKKRAQQQKPKCDAKSQQSSDGQLGEAGQAGVVADVGARPTSPAGVAPGPSDTVPAPVAWRYRHKDIPEMDWRYSHIDMSGGTYVCEPLYAAPPRSSGRAA